MDAPSHRAEIDSLLSWWTDAGVDVLLDEEPNDWLKPPPVPVEAAPAALAAPPPPPPAVVLPDQLPLFFDWLKASDTLPYAAPGAPRVCPSGDPASDLMILLAAPSQGDCSEGALLTGPAGRLFDRMLAAIGRDRTSIYLTALAVKRPPAGRVAPEASEKLDALIRHHLALAAPKRVLALGNAASRAITGMDVAHARGSLRAIHHDKGTSEVVASFHPRFLLERPAAKADAWRDLKLLIGGFE